MCYVIIASFELEISIWGLQAQTLARLVLAGVELSLLSSEQQIITRRCLS